MPFAPVPPDDERIAAMIVNAAFVVHKVLRARAPRECLRDLPGSRASQAKPGCERQEPVPIVYDNLRFEEAFRFDLLVGNRVLCEIKAVQDVHPICMAQLLTYLKLMDLRLGFLINFHVPLIKEGIQRVVGESTIAI